MTEGAHKRLGFSAISGRKAKAEKITAILTAAGRPLNPTDDVLDLGCGSGEIAAHLSSDCRMGCADAEDQRTHGLDLPFHTADAVLPFPDASFDVVLSNHVIEHTQDPAAHLREIRRILKPEGVAYLATPNRLWPWEVHAHLPLLHYLPWRLFSRIGMALGRLHEPVRLLTSQRLRQATRGQFSVEVWHHRILSRPEDYALRLPAWMTRLLRATPEFLLTLTAPMQPTLIVLLSPK
jgi:SAM-dependent methyltransferase